MVDIDAVMESMRCFSKDSVFDDIHTSPGRLIVLPSFQVP